MEATTFPHQFVSLAAKLSQWGLLCCSVHFPSFGRVRHPPFIPSWQRSSALPPSTASPILLPSLSPSFPQSLPPLLPPSLSPTFSPSLNPFHLYSHPPLSPSLPPSLLPSIPPSTAPTLPFYLTPHSFSPSLPTTCTLSYCVHPSCWLQRDEVALGNLKLRLSSDALVKEKHILGKSKWHLRIRN